MKRALTILAVTAAGALTASTSARAADEVSADRILNSIYNSLGMESSPEEIELSRSGFFFGVHKGMAMESGLAPATAGFASPLNLDPLTTSSISANGYYVFNTSFSLGTYVGGGFGRFNLSDDPLLNTSSANGNLGYQGMAGLTYSFTPSMVMGLEYRYTETVQSNQFTESQTPAGEEDQTVTLRFDFLLN